MKLTKKFLEDNNACQEAQEWFDSQKNKDISALFKNLVKEKKPLGWANWCVSRKLPKLKKIQYACYAAKQVLKNFEDKFPDDKRPREAIDAALKCIKNNTAKNRSAAESAAWSAWSAAQSAAWSAAESAAQSAAQSAAWSAAESAWSAAESAQSAAESAESAAWSAAESAAWSAVMIKILKYGSKLLLEK